MSFIENARFPFDYSYGTRGGPAFSTDVTKLRHGAVEANARHTYPLHVYDVSKAIQGFDNLKTLRSFFIGVNGPAHQFRFRDLMDWSTDPDYDGPDGDPVPAFDDQVIATGDGSTKIFQLARTYVIKDENGVPIVGGPTRTRPITKPVSPVLSGYGGVQKTENTDFTVNYTNGLLTYTTAPTNGAAVTWGGNHDVPCGFDPSLDEGLLATIDDFDDGSVPSILLYEATQDVAVLDELFFGGRAEFSTSADFSITHLNGRVIVITPGANNIQMYLPDASRIPDGGEHFFLVNTHATNDVLVRTSAGNPVGTLDGTSDTNKGRGQIVLATVGGVKTWYLY